MSKEEFRCGYIAIIGRPNVGKSTLMNRILGQKISITSHKPQTTRHQILGIKSESVFQAIYVDTPGIHLGAKKAMNRYMNRSASSALADVNVIVFVVTAGKWTDEDENVLGNLVNTKAPVILAVNKIDLLKERGMLLPYIDKIAKKYTFHDVIPLSATAGDNVSSLEEKVIKLLPQGIALFPEEQVTDKTVRFMAAEMIREKLMRKLHQEIPYALTVEIEKFKEEENIINIDAVIWVERKSQKGIVIGKGGATLKDVGKQARIDMEKNYDKKVFLNLWVKVREGWSDNERLLKSFGYSDDLT